VAPLDPVFRAQVFEIDPARLRSALGHRLHVGLGRIAAERLDDDVGHLDRCKRVAQPRDFHALELLAVEPGIDLRAQLREHREVVEPQAHGLAVLAREQARKAP
jgi:hypothetical protein